MPKAQCCTIILGHALSTGNIIVKVLPPNISSFQTVSAAAIGENQIHLGIGIIIRFIIIHNIVRHIGIIVCNVCVIVVIVIGIVNLVSVVLLVIGDIIISLICVVRNIVKCFICGIQHLIIVRSFRSAGIAIVVNIIVLCAGVGHMRKIIV